MAEAHHSQLKVRTQSSSKLLQEFSHQALVVLPINIVQGRKVKQHLLLEDERFPNKVLDQALKLEAVKVPTRPPIRLWEIRAVVATWEHSYHQLSNIGLDGPNAGSGRCCVRRKRRSTGT